LQGWPEIQLVTQVAISLPDHPRRITGDDAVWLDIFGDDSSGSDNCPLPDRHSRQNKCPVSDPHPVPDGHISSAQREVGGLRIVP
jgi:hypothetical protein